MFELPTDKEGNLFTKIYKDFNDDRIALNSYNNLVTNLVNEYLHRINTTNPLRLNDRFNIIFVSLVFYAPQNYISNSSSFTRVQDTPEDARLNRRTYECPIRARFYLQEREKVGGVYRKFKVYSPNVSSNRMVDLQLVQINNPEEVNPDTSVSEYTLYIGKMPVMIGSVLDPTRNTRGEIDLHEVFDVNGYFIINGGDKFFNNIERLRYNYPYTQPGRGKVKDVVIKYHSQYITNNITTFREVVTKEEKVIMYHNTNMIDDETHYDKYINMYSLLFYMVNGPQVLQNLSPVDFSRMFNIANDTIIDSISSLEDRQRVSHYLVDTKIAFYNDIMLYQNGNTFDMVRYYTDIVNLYKNSKLRGSNIEVQLNSIIKHFVFSNIDSIVVSQQNLARKNITYQDFILGIKIRTYVTTVTRYVDYLTGVTEMDDRDSWANKILMTAGQTMESRLINTLRDIINEANYKSDRKMYSSNYNSTTISSSEFNILNTSKLNTDILTAFSKNTFMTGIQVVEPMKEDNFALRHSLINRIASPSSAKSGLLMEKRLNHNSQFNVICFANTPDGSNCGLVKSVTANCFVSIQKTNDINNSILTSIVRNSKSLRFTRHDDNKILQYFKDNNLVPQDQTLNPDILALMNTYMIDNDINIEEDDYYILSFNGAFIGYCLVSDIDNLRSILKTRETTFDVGISYTETKEIMINTSGGRLGSFYLKKNPETSNLLIDDLNMWEYPPIELIKAGVLEYIDSNEASHLNFTCASSIETYYSEPDVYTHSLVTPQSLLSAITNTVPFANKQPAARSTYQTSMTKQAISADSFGAKNRFDTTLRILESPSVAIVANDINKCLGLQDFPNGFSALTAFNVSENSQEDALQFNKTSLENGLCNLSIYTSVREKITSGHDVSYTIEYPFNDPKRINNPAYSKLSTQTDAVNYNGVVKLGEFVNPKDVLYTITRKQNKTNAKGESSVEPYTIARTVDVNKSGYIDKINITGVNTADRSKNIQIRMKKSHIPEVGDKFCSRYSQKGVIGETPRASEMIKLNTGSKIITPDIVFNSHGFTSRMTIGKLIEPLVANYAVCRMMRINSSCFRDINMDLISSELETYGLPRNCAFEATDAHGYPIGKVSMGIIYYYALRHLVAYKIQYRRIGLTNSTTHQPLKGSKAGGGIRVEEMAIHALFASGAQFTLYDRLVVNSDYTKLVVCMTCGLYASVVNFQHGGIVCSDKNCVGKEFRVIITPYSWKLQQVYSQGLGVDMRQKVVGVEKLNFIKMN